MESLSFWALARFIQEAKQEELNKNDYLIIYEIEPNFYNSFKYSDLETIYEKKIYFGKQPFINIIGVIRVNCITNTKYYTRWGELTPEEQDVLFGIAIDIKNNINNY